MKKIKLILGSIVLAMGLTSCESWLDVNQDPDNPTAESATPDIRLPWIQNYFTYAWGSASMRTSQIYGVLTQTSTTSANGCLAKWNPLQSSATTPYQNWFIGAGVNVDPLVAKATAVGANHYAGVALIIESMGFNLMSDLYGEIPMKEAYTGKYDPTYDDGKDLWFMCMDDLEKGIEYLKKTNVNYPLSQGDCWLNGDADKWIKFAYGLKARYIAKLSKKFGKEITKKDGTKVTYTEQDVLDALALSLKSNDDNVSIKNYNIDGDETNITVGDPVQANMLWNSLAYGSSQRITKYYVDLFKADDPRIDKLVPSVMTHVKLKADGSLESYKWTRAAGVDMLNKDNNIRMAGNISNAAFVEGSSNTIKYTIEEADARSKFVNDMIATAHDVTVNDKGVKVVYKKGQIYVNSTDYRHAGDTIYANMASRGFETSGRGEYDTYYYYSTNTSVPYVSGTGTFYGRINSDLDLMTYAELCFLKAEMLLRQNKNPEALQAYKDGVKANFERMQKKLTEWGAQKTSVTAGVDENPTMQPMDAAAVSAYLATVNAKSAVDIAEIMREKFIAVSFNYELWNDMRRYDYSSGKVNGVKAFPNFKRPCESTAVTKFPGSVTSSDDFSVPQSAFRRWMQSTHETNYNLVNLKASNTHAVEDDIYSIPTWWDCATDDEYYNYGITKTYK